VELTYWAQATGERPPMIAQFFPLIIMVVMFYFILIRPQQKKMKDHQKMVAAIKSGEKVVAAGGIHGMVTNVKDNTVVLKIAEQVKIEVDKNSITQVKKEETE
ncbi:MAG: preprotein translocase subunit YajC, partial [Verrucomicrobiota bacterium]